MTEIWVFTGARSTPSTNATFPGGVFSSRLRAEEWITKHGLSGVLTMYRLDVGAYDWAVENGAFKPKKPHHFTPEFIGRFAGGEIHFHYETGKRGGPPENEAKDQCSA
jgi:hypothetical protein